MSSFLCSDVGHPGGDREDQRSRLPHSHAEKAGDSRHHHTHRLRGKSKAARIFNNG